MKQKNSDPPLQTHLLELSFSPPNDRAKVFTSLFGEIVSKPAVRVWCSEVKWSVLCIVAYRQIVAFKMLTLRQKQAMEG